MDPRFFAAIMRKNGAMRDNGKIEYLENNDTLNANLSNHILFPY